MKKESKGQVHLIVANGGGRSAPEVETAWMEDTAGSLCGDIVGHGALPT